MARQVRSEATRRKLLDAAVDVFAEVGYGAAARVSIIERAGVTKGALYHHFDSMDALASAVIEEGLANVSTAFRGMCRPSSPALEGMIHGTFAAAAELGVDSGARVAGQLVRALGEFNEAAAAAHARWLQEVADQAGQAIAEGDLRADLDPQAVAEAIAGAMFGVLPPGADPVGRLARTWELLLPGVVTDQALSYFRQFLAREVLRRGRGASAGVP